MISLETDNEILQNLFKPPIIGAIIIFLVAIIPVPTMFIINGLFDIMPNELLERVNALITGCWNVLLTYYFRVKISLLFIPCWILFIIIGIVRLLDFI